MKQRGGKNQKITKGMSSAVLLSIAIHAALFLLAGMLVVFTVVKKEEKVFEPPAPVKRPKMKLKKPKVRVKKTSTPKPTQRIVTKMNRASMPEIQLPEMSGIGEDFGVDLGGFDMMPDLEEVTIFGSGQSIGNDFVGTFYDFKRDRQGRYNSTGFSFMDMGSGYTYWGIVHDFLRDGWKPSTLARYFRSPRKLYATTFVAPSDSSVMASLSFGDEKAGGSFWVVHYTGQLVCPASHTNGITFRFWGQGDDFLIVRVGGKIVMGVAWPPSPWDNVEGTVIGTLWKSDSADARKYWMGNNRSLPGDWITLEPGESRDMEVIIGDWGGASCYMLAVEEEGVEYERNRQGGPLLPAFKTTKPSHDLLDAIYPRLVPGELCMTNGPVFSDYDTSGSVAAVEEPETTPGPSVPEVSGEPEMRRWTLSTGQTVEAEFVTVIGIEAALKNATGKIRKIPLEQLSPEDRTYIELARPPVFDVNFSKKERQQLFTGRYPRPPKEEATYGVRFKQTSTGTYDHELHAEMFAIGQQHAQTTGKYELLDRQQTSFNPAEEEQRTYEFRSDRKVVLTGGTRPGSDYEGYLVTLTDERGVVVAVETSHQWLA
ncbi:MAG: hypothetical protein ABFR33_05615, partial [Verrucomicrobiota bacterium]